MNIFMKAITLADENRIDKISDKSSIYFYGDVNLKDKQDLDTIKNYNFVNTDNLGMLYSYFDYEQGHFRLVTQLVGKEIENVVKWGPCTDPIAWFKYNHCLLGKPKKVIVYNEYYEYRLFGRR